MRSLTLWENILLGKDYLLNYQRVYNFPSLSPEEIKEYQFKKIQDLISLAYNHTEFYRNLYNSKGIYPEDIKTWEDFKKLPTVTKDDLVAAKETCIVDTKRKNKNLIISRSSGSSGKLIDVFFEGSSWVEQALMTLRMYQRSFPYKPFDKQALIYTSEYPYRSIMGLYRATYFNALTPPEILIKKLTKLQPAVIAAYPSIVMELASKFPEECESLHPVAISTNSEQSTQRQRDYISSIFRCPVYDEYSTEELTLLGYQCQQKKYHLQEDCAYLEIVDPQSDQTLEENTPGEIVGTCIVNNVMPFIRYRQGDLGSIKQSDCTCENNCRILAEFSGRKGTVFILEDGREILSSKILDWTYIWFLNFKLPIIQFQIIQLTKKLIEIIIIPDTSYNETIHDQIIIDSLIKMLGVKVDVKITKVSSIPKSPVGKHIPIKSLVERN